jgi:hypothetical protein
VLRKVVFFTATAVVAAAGFVAAGLAAVGGGCPPGSPCAPGTGTNASTTASTSTSIPKGPKPSLKVSPSTIDFGTTLTFTGTVPGAPAGQSVEILSQTCGFNQILPVGKTKTKADGSFVFAIQPMLNASFYSRSANATSDLQALNVRPKIELSRSGQTFHVNVSAGGGSFFSTMVTLERYDQAHKLWRTVAKGKLHAASDPAEIIAVSSATIRAKIAAGARVRASANRASVGKCYRPATSAAITA